MSISTRDGWQFCELTLEATNMLLREAEYRPHLVRRVHSDESGSAYQCGDDLLSLELNGSGDGYVGFWCANWFANKR